MISFGKRYRRVKLKCKCDTNPSIFLDNCGITKSEDMKIEKGGE